MKAESEPTNEVRAEPNLVCAMPSKEEVDRRSKAYRVGEINKKLKMKKLIKCGVAVAVVVAAGFVAYQSYGVYSIQNNSLLMQNVEALAADPKETVSNKAIEYVYGSEYTPTGIKAGLEVSLNANLVSTLMDLIGKKKRGKTIAANVKAYMDYTERSIYQKNCIDFPGSNCVCSATNNGKWIYKPKPTPSWWGQEEKTCY